MDAWLVTVGAELFGAVGDDFGVRHMVGGQQFIELMGMVHHRHQEVDVRIGAGAAEHFC